MQKCYVYVVLILQRKNSLKCNVIVYPSSYSMLHTKHHHQSSDPMKHIQLLLDDILYYYKLLDQLTDLKIQTFFGKGGC